MKFDCLVLWFVLHLLLYICIKLVNYFSNDRLVTKRQNVPSKMQLISKYFYIENAYDDSTSDHPKLRWRYRNSYSENDVNGQRTHNYDFSDSSLGDSHDYSNNIAQDDSKEASDSQRTELDTKRILVSILKLLCT